MPENVQEQMDMAKETYEQLVQENGFIKGTILYYKLILGSGEVD